MEHKKETKQRMDKIAKEIVDDLFHTTADSYGLGMAENLYNISEKIVCCSKKMALTYLENMAILLCCDEAMVNITLLKKGSELDKEYFFQRFLEYGKYILGEIFLESFLCSF